MQDMVQRGFFCLASTLNTELSEGMLARSRVYIQLLDTSLNNKRYKLIYGMEFKLSLFLYEKLIEYIRFILIFGEE